MKISKNRKLPNWFTLPPLEDGSYMVLEDPMIKEMFKVFSERLPKYNQELLNAFIQRDADTLIHGDFHSGNQQFGMGENDGQVMALDFQLSGLGLVSIDVANLLFTSMDIINYKEIEDIIKGILLIPQWFTLGCLSFFFFFSHYCTR